MKSLLPSVSLGSPQVQRKWRGRSIARRAVRAYPFRHGRGRIAKALSRGYPKHGCFIISFGGPHLPLRYQESLGQVTLAFGGFEVAEVSYLVGVAESASVVFDVGANVGYHSLALATCRPDVVVHALEPTPDAASRFLEWSGTVPNVHLHQVAVGEQEGQVVLDCPVDGAYARVTAAVQPLASGSGGFPITTLDRVWSDLGKPRVSLVKVDVEGYEHHVIRGATGLLAQEHPVLVLETHDHASTDAMLLSIGYVPSKPSRRFEPWNRVYNAIGICSD